MKSRSRKRPLFADVGIGKERVNVLENLSVLVDSGMSVLEALQVLERDARTRGMRFFIGTIVDAVSDGEALWRACQHTKIFPPHTISLMRIGEESGELPQMLGIIASTETRRRELRSQVQSALMYPILVVGVTVMVALGVSWFILPRLISVFGRLNVELPVVTEWLLVFAGFLKDHGMIAVPSFVALLVFVVLILFVFPRTRFIGQTLMFHTPGVNKLVREVELSRFGFFLGTLLKAGIPISAALKLLVATTSFPVYKKFFQYLLDGVMSGDSFETIFREYKKSRKLIPLPVQQMVLSAERGGALSDNFVKIGEMYEKRIALTSKNLMALLEPILLIVIWFGVVGIALAVILPIYGLLSGINRGGNPPPPPPPVVEVVPNVDPFEDLSQVQVVEDTPFLRVRSGPSTDAEEIFQLQPGDTAYVKSESDGWYELLFEEGDTGWVFGEYVSEIATDNE